AKVSAEIATALYQAAVAAADAAVRAGAGSVRMAVTGKSNISIRVSDTGTKGNRARALSVARLLAEEAGLQFEVVTGKSTIVSIRYAVRRSISR
ncbi:MAG: hypothetical protein ABI995_06995, partial [Acidobacteriota bacterium]